MLEIAAQYNLECWQLDDNTVFLNTDITVEVYVKMLPGYEKFEKSEVSLELRLLKSLYGLARARETGGTRSTNIKLKN